MDLPLIQFIDVHKQFGPNHVLRGANLSIYRGQVTTIIGKSGVGKSVLLKHIIGLLEPDTGQILYEGRPLGRMKKSERRSLKRTFSYMFQGTALFDSMTVYENIALPLKERTRMTDAQIRDKVHEKMDALDLHDIDDRYPSQLSGGMNKRVALARALVTDPQIVLFDEPTTGLDPIRKNAVHNMISEYQKRYGFTSVVVSHEIPDIFYISQRVAMLDEGRIFVEGSPEEVQNSTDPVVQQFIHGLTHPENQETAVATEKAGEERYLQEMARLERHGAPFSLVILTFENLEKLHDRIGHMAGQDIMNKFADALNKKLRITDACCRYGLNQILLILANTDEPQAENLCNKLSEEIRGDNFAGGPDLNGFCLTVTSGITAPAAGNPMEETVRRAFETQRQFLEVELCDSD